MRYLQLCLLLLVIGFATGCPKPQYQPTLSFEQGMVDKFNAALKRQYREYECYRFGPTHIDFQGRVCTGFVENADKAKTVRNELVDNALHYIDQSYNAFVIDLQAGRDQTNFTLDLVELGTAATVGITKGERPLQIIGVALTAFRGGRRSIDANFYKDTSVPILISKMDGNRARVHALILENRTKSADVYSLGAAVTDIVKYYNAGTLVRAFSQLDQDTAIITEQLEKNLEDTKKKLGVKGAPTAEDVARSTKNAQDVRALRTAYIGENKKVQDADATITAAGQEITAADADITSADQRIGAATAKITAAANNQTKKALAEAEKATAEADKVKAQAKKTTAEGKKTTAEAAKATAATARDEAFKKLRATYDAIAGDAQLGPVLKTVPDDPNLTPVRKTALQGMLQRNQGRAEPSTDAERDLAITEYTSILHEFAQIVAAKFKEQPELNQRLQEILKANE